MADLTSYFEEDFNAGGAPSEEKDLSKPIELSQEDKDRLFFDFDKIPDLIAAFIGPGQTYTWQGHTIKTWQFKDMNGLTWLIPQWAVLEQPQGNFKGFTEEIPGEYKYYIKYNGKKEGKHDVAIFRRRN